MQIGFYYQGLIGKYCIVEEERKLVRLWFGDRIDHVSGEFVVKETALLRLAYEQLDAYFSGRLKKFDLPLLLRGTVFQLNVWHMLQEIPYGEFITYKDLACRVGNVKAARAVGSANGRNPLPIFVPCHRVVGSKGKLGGYAGGLEIKRRLLSLERDVLSSD